MSSVHCFLHSFQHINHSFAPVSDTFILPQSYSAIYNMHTENQYEQSIQMFFIVPLEIVAVYVLIYSIVVLIYCCYGKPLCIAFNFQTFTSSNNRNIRIDSDSKHLLPNHSHNYNYKNKKNGKELKISLTSCAKWTRITLAIGAFILIASSIYCAILLDQTANTIGNNINSSYQPYQQNIIYGNQINKSLTAAINSVHDQTINNELIASRLYLNKYLLSATQIPPWGSTKSYLDFSHSFSQFVIYFGMLIAVVLAVCFFMSMFSKTMVKFMSCLTFLCIFILLTLFALQFAFSVNISDACTNPNKAILQIANNKTSQLQTLKYYLYCNNDIGYNPLYYNFNISYHKLLSHPVADNQYYNLSLFYMSKLNKSLQCDQLYTYKQAVVDSVCTDGISQWFRIYIIQFGLVFILLIRNCCLCCGVKYSYHYHKKVHKIMDYHSISMTSEDMADDDGDHMFSVSECNQSKKYIQYSINTPPMYANQITVDSPSFDDSLTIYRFNDNKLIKIYVRRENGKTEYIKMSGSLHKTIHDLKQKIQIKYGYPVQTQKILFNDSEYGCNNKLNEIGIKNGTMIYLKLRDDLNDFCDNFTIEYNGYIELNSYVSPYALYDADDADEPEGDYWSIRIVEWCIHNVSDFTDISGMAMKSAQNQQMIGVICYQYNGKVEWSLNGIKCKSGDVIIKNVKSLKYCQYETMYESIFGVCVDGKFIGNGFKINKYGKIKLFSNQRNKIGKIELFWLDVLLKVYKEKGIKSIEIEQYQKEYNRYRYDIDKFDCELCGIDQYSFKEQNVYSLLTE